MSKDDVSVYAWGLVALSACTALDDEATTRSVNLSHPTGISSRWEISEDDFHDGLPNGCPCEKDPARRHLLFEC